MRRVIWLGLLVTGIALLLVYLRPYYGYVLIIVGPYRLESTAIVVGFIGLALWLVCSSVLQLLGKLLHFGGWLKRYRQERAQEQFLAALLKSLEGDYAEAEKSFVRCGAGSKQPDLCYLLAADAARQQGRWQQMQRYLSQVACLEPHGLALQIGWARVQLATQPAAVAARSVQNLLRCAPKHPMVRQLAQRLNRQPTTAAEFSCDV